MTERVQTKNWKKPVSLFFAVAGGFILSFSGLGALWVGTPWHYQFLMFFPFLLLSFAVTRTCDAGDKAFLLILYGAMPIGALILLFRDKNDSHLMPILVVCSWVAGTLLGHFLANRSLQKVTQSHEVHPRS